MEIDPLKVPAFMRKKTVRKKKDDGPSAYFRASEPPKAAQPKRSQAVKKVSLPSFTPSPSRSQAPKSDGVAMPIGVVTGYLDNINVAIVKLGADLEVGVRLELVGEDGPFKQSLKSMQLNRKEVQRAIRGEEIGMKVFKKVQVGEMVYLLN